MRFRDDAWFSGFTAGEGCFMIVPRPGIKGHQVWFTLGLRDDDSDVLEALSAEFGGRVTSHPRQQNDTTNRRDRTMWIVTAKSDLRRLVEYFDRFPLHARKARDYGIWREAALAYIAEGSRASELAELRARLLTEREYVCPS